tara:strand:- start:4043 stop:4369 length:327 start_codon:yes stop_codon:yes gene_type:complete
LTRGFTPDYYSFSPSGFFVPFRNIKIISAKRYINPKIFTIPNLSRIQFATTLPFKVLRGILFILRGSFGFDWVVLVFIYIQLHTASPPQSQLPLKRAGGYKKMGFEID